MANKEINELTAKSEIVGDDLIPVYDSEEAGTEKLKKSTLSDLKMVKWNPLTGSLSSPSLIIFHGVSTPILTVGAPESDNLTVLSAADMIVSVIENGDPPYLYGINRVGDAPSVIHADPRDAILILDCNDFNQGYVLIEVHIKDNSSRIGTVESYFLITDPRGSCGP